MDIGGHFTACDAVHIPADETAPDGNKTRSDGNDRTRYHAESSKCTVSRSGGRDTEKKNGSKEES